MMRTNLNEERVSFYFDGFDNGYRVVDTNIAEIGSGSPAARQSIISKYVSNIVRNALDLADG